MTLALGSGCKHRGSVAHSQLLTSCCVAQRLPGIVFLRLALDMGLSVKQAFILFAYVFLGCLCVPSPRVSWAVEEALCPSFW